MEESKEELLDLGIPGNIEKVINYYHEKYPDRPHIRHITYYHENKKDFEELSLNLNMIKDEKLPCKIIITSKYRDSKDQQFYHSEPIILQKGSPRKIIFPKQPGIIMNRTLAMLEENNFVIIKQKKCNENYQYDSISCHAIALKILASINKEELLKYSELEKDFDPFPREQKYSQSIEYIKQYDNLANMIVKNKKNPITLESYIKDGRTYDRFGGVESSKISKKWQKWTNLIKNTAKSFEDAKPGQLYYDFDHEDRDVTRLKKQR